MAPSPLSWPQGIPVQEAESIRLACHRAWQRGLLSGFNGNMSVRTGDTGELCLVTRSGAAKGALRPDDLCLLRLADGAILAGGPPSSELAMHLAIYREQPKALAVAHTHPPHLLALGLVLPWEERLNMPIFEAEPLYKRFTMAPDFDPGTQELAEAVGLAAKFYEAVWMEGHGLAVWGKDLHGAGALSEELEHLAKVRLLALGR